MRYRNLTLKYALANGGYMLLLCATSGYVYNFLSQSGFSDSMTGTIIAFISAVGLFVQPWAGSFVDRSEKVTEKKFASWMMLITAVLALMMAFIPKGQFLIIPIIVTAFSAVGVALPLLNSLAFCYENDGQKIDYGLCRGAGSAAFAVGSKAVGMLWTRFGRGSYPIYIAVIALFTCLMISIMPDVPDNTRTAEKSESSRPAGSGDSYAVFFRKNKQVAVICVSLVLLYFMHMICNTYIAKIVGQFTEPSQIETVQGTALFIAGMCELPAMLGFSALMKKVSVMTIMKTASVFYTVKHLMIFLSGSAGMFYAAMVMQMLSYAAVIPATVYYGGKYIAEADRNKGQAVLGMTVTIGTLLAGFVGGQLFQYMSVRSVLLIGVLASAAGTAIMVFCTKDPEKEGQKA